MSKHAPGAATSFTESSERFQLEGPVYGMLEVRDARPWCQSAVGAGLIGVYFQLGGEQILSGPHPPGRVRVSAPAVYVDFTPRGARLRREHVCGQPSQTVSLHFAPNALLEIPPLQEFGPLSRQIASLVPAIARAHEPCRPVISSRMIVCGRDMLTAPFAGELRRAYLATKARELLHLLSAALDEQEGQDSPEFTRVDLDCFRRAHRILATRFQPAPTIASLARELGTNETKLKRGFKEYFGQTLFDFGLQCRMTHALHLLRDRQLHISVVASSVGYRHQGAFASAFRAFFGFLPKHARKPVAVSPVMNSRVSALAAQPSTGQIGRLGVGARYLPDGQPASAAQALEAAP